MPRGRKYVGPIDEQVIGARIREIRNRRRMSQQDLARQLGIDQSLISEYERGVVRIHGSLVVGLATTLRVSTDELLGIKTLNGHGEEPYDRRFLRRLQKVSRLSRRDQQVLLRNIDAFLKGAGADE